MSEIRHSAMATSSQSLRPGAQIERHRHPLHQIVYPSRGAVSVTTTAGMWITPPNRAIWIPAGHWHEHRFHGQTQFHTVALDPQRYSRGPAAPAVLAVSPLMRELIIACSQTEATDTDEHQRMLAVLHDQLQATSSQEPLWIPIPVDTRLRQACAMVADNLATPLTLQQISRRVGASQRTLSRLYRDELAMTYPQWRTQLRLHHALLLLAEHHDVTTPSAFIDTYRRALGHTPGRR
jgi:AraC-like DNA-binding protein